MKVHSTIDPDFPLVQTLGGAHKLGCHHLVSSRSGQKAASVGFEGEVKLWRLQRGPDGEEKQEKGEEWVDDGNVVGVQ